MNPLIPLAAATFPTIIDLVRSSEDDNSPFLQAVAKAVEDTTGSKNADEAKAKLASDTESADALRFKLAAIAVDKSLISKKPSQLAQNDAETYKADLANTNQARQNLLEFVKKNDPIALTPSVISYIVTIGFLLVPLLLMSGQFTQVFANDKSSAVLNVCLGALATAFATVMNFWLGSSLGSQRKDSSFLASTAIQQVKAAVPGRSVPPDTTGPR